MSVVTWKRCSKTGRKTPTIIATNHPPASPPRTSAAKSQPRASPFKNAIAEIATRFAAATTPPIAEQDAAGAQLPDPEDAGQRADEREENEREALPHEDARPDGVHRGEEERRAPSRRRG